MPTCRQLADDLASGRYEELGLLQRWKLRLHAFLCPPCRAYADQMRLISSAARDLACDRQPCREELDRMKARCLERLKADGATACRGSDDAGGRDSD